MMAIKYVIYHRLALYLHVKMKNAQEISTIHIIEYYMISLSENLLETSAGNWRYNMSYLIIIRR